MALPPMTPEQRAGYQAAALATRAARADLKRKLKSGELTLAAGTAGQMKVSALLASLPRMGKVTAARVMERVGIAENRRVGGLGERQRKALEREFATADA